MLIEIPPSPWVQIWWRIGLLWWLSWLWATPGSVVSLTRLLNPSDCRIQAHHGPPVIPSTPLLAGPKPWEGEGAELGGGWHLGGLLGILHRLLGLGAECHTGSPSLHLPLGCGWTLGIPHRQVSRHSCRGCVTPEGLCAPGLWSPFYHPLQTFLSPLCPGSASSPTHLTGSSPTGRSFSQTPVPALYSGPRWSPSLCSPAGENACCLLGECFAGYHSG